MNEVRQRTSRLGQVAVVVAGLMLLVFLVYMAYRFVYPAPHRVVTVDSPDGRYRLIIFEDVPKPRPLMQSPYIYRLCIYDRSTNRPLPGSMGTQDNDSCITPTDDFQVVWTGSSVRVRATNPGPRLHHGTVTRGRQDWHSGP